MDGLLEDPARKAVRLGNCTGHGYHADCITDSFKHKPMCPVCSFVYSPLLGNQPGGWPAAGRPSLGIHCLCQ